MRCIFFATLLLATPVHAAPMVVAWTTWLYAAPSQDSQSVDEIRSGWTVDVQTCDGGWCRVVSNRALGYIPQALLAPGRDAPIKPATEGCFPAEHVTPERAISMTICPGQPR